MGGCGSGSHHSRWRQKAGVVDDCLSLDATRWTREGILKAGASRCGSWQWTYRSGNRFVVYYSVDTAGPGAPAVHLSYSWVWPSTGEQGSADYPVRLTTTRPQFGGVRWWFVCPLVVNGRACGRRVGKLYLPPRGRYFGCRHCYDLTYASCRESRKYDSMYRFMAKNTGWDVADVRRAMNRIGKRPRK